MFLGVERCRAYDGHKIRAEAKLLRWLGAALIPVCYQQIVSRARRGAPPTETGLLSFAGAGQVAHARCSGTVRVNQTSKVLQGFRDGVESCRRLPPRFQF